MKRVHAKNNILADWLNFFQSVKHIEAGLGLAGSSPKLGAIGNFPHITDKHKSLSCKAMKQNPELYSKYANVKTPMGFTFDQAIQVALPIRDQWGGGGM